MASSYFPCADSFPLGLEAVVHRTFSSLRMPAWEQESSPERVLLLLYLSQAASHRHVDCAGSSLSSGTWPFTPGSENCWLVGLEDKSFCSYLELLVLHRSEGSFLREDSRGHCSRLWSQRMCDLGVMSGDSRVRKPVFGVPVTSSLVSGQFCLLSPVPSSSNR